MNMEKNNKKEKNLKRLDELLVELKNCDPKNLVEYTSKFTEFYNLFKETFPKSVHEYSQKTGPTQD